MMKSLANWPLSIAVISRGRHRSRKPNMALTWSIHAQNISKPSLNVSSKCTFARRREPLLHFLQPFLARD